MDHPVFQNFKSFIIYLSAWVVLIIVQAIILYSYFPESPGLVITDSLIFNLTFALCGLTIWYTIKYFKPGKKAWINALISQVTTLVILVLLWVELSTWLLSLFISDNPGYQALVNDALPLRYVVGILYYFIIALIFYLIIYYRDLNEKLLAEVQLKGILKETELKMLKSQINPHFLFNSLNSISSLTITDPPKAQQMIIKLSDFLRYNVSSSADMFLPLYQEFENITRYLEIEKIRFGEKLLYEFNLNDRCSDQKIPVMLLQPLYENAVKHGVYESSEPIKITTTCTVRENYFEITIINNFEPGVSSKKGAGLGLSNIRERLKLLYRDDRLIQTARENNEFKVTIIIPKQQK